MDNVVPIGGERTVSSLKVLNDNNFAIEDMYDGVPYLFEPHKPITIPAEAALHIFGWYPGVDPKALKQHITKRWGWNTPAIVEKGDHTRFFEKLLFTPVRYKLVEVVAEETETAEPEQTPGQIAVNLPEIGVPAKTRGTGGRFARKDEAATQP